MSSRLSRPYVSMPVVYRAYGGSEYAAIVTDVRPEGVSLVTFQPGSASGLAVSRIPFKASIADLRPQGDAPFCYFVQPPNGYEPRPALAVTSQHHQTGE